jgi:sulfur-carrier protein adenylyltransferase/sulfurtransferase
MDANIVMPNSTFAEPVFSYDQAFSRNLGWVTEGEQQAMRQKCVAIAGMGGVGGAYLLTLTRLGVGGFRIADLDRFELVNFNRQAGATLDALGRPKVEVMAERARQINPELRISSFGEGVSEANLDAFLAGADVCMDAIDFFELDIRRRLMARCAELGIPVILAAPLGMGAAYLVFRPGGMSFERWFRLDGLTPEQQYVNFLLGLAPAGFHRSYLVDPSRVDLRGRRGPSTAAACELCAGVAAVEAVKLLLGRGRVRAVPYHHHFDAYRGRWTVKRLPAGNGNPVQRLKIILMRRLAARWSQRATAVLDVGAPAIGANRGGS